MMNKTLLSFGLATALVVGAGTAVAGQSDSGDSTPATAAVGDRDRDQLNDCDLFDGDALQVRDRDQLRDAALVDGDPARVRQRVREHVRTASDGENGTAGAGFGEGVLDGTGPRHDGPADGTGSQFGRGDR